MNSLFKDGMNARTLASHDLRIYLGFFYVKPIFGYLLKNTPICILRHSPGALEISNWCQGSELRRNDGGLFGDQQRLAGVVSHIFLG